MQTQLGNCSFSRIEVPRDKPADNRSVSKSIYKNCKSQLYGPHLIHQREARVVAGGQDVDCCRYRLDRGSLFPEHAVEVFEVPRTHRKLVALLPLSTFQYFLFQVWPGCGLQLRSSFRFALSCS